MKNVTYLFLAFFLLSCISNHQKEEGLKIENNQAQGKMEKADEIKNLSENKYTEDTDVFCDTTKFPDFQENLELIADEIENTEYQDKKAKNFIDELCAKDSLFCGEITKKQSKSFRFNSEWALDLVGYVLGKESGIEENSASFFVLTINRNGKIWFTDILSDLMGEIQVALNGFDDKNGRVKVWGYVYPYFEPNYGRFELTIKNGIGLYEYECHSQK